MSTPAQNPRPAARSTTTCVSGSRPAAVTASASANQPATGSALTGGWSIATTTTPGSAVSVETLMSDPLDDRARGERATSAHRDQRGGAVAAFQLVQRGRDQPCAGAADGVAE